MTLRGMVLQGRLWQNCDARGVRVSKIRPKNTIFLRLAQTRVCILFWWRRVFQEKQCRPRFLTLSEYFWQNHSHSRWLSLIWCQNKCFRSLLNSPTSFRCLRDIANTIKRRPAISHVHSISIFPRNESCKCTSVFVIPLNIVFLNNNHWHFSRAPQQVRVSQRPE